MKIPKKVVLLGWIASFEWEDLEGFSQKKAVKAREHLALVCNDSMKKIFFLPVSKKSDFLPVGMTKHETIYRIWSTFDAYETFEIKVPNLELSKLGFITSIIYRSDKWTGKMTRYIHEFKKSTSLFSDRKTNPRAWGVMQGNKKLISSRGIIG